MPPLMTPVITFSTALGSIPMAAIIDTGVGKITDAGVGKMKTNNVTLFQMEEEKQKGSCEPEPGATERTRAPGNGLKPSHTKIGASWGYYPFLTLRTASSPNWMNYKVLFVNSSIHCAPIS
uniref:Uncharacterized protein n=1 Tax=Glossina austeni TaxID=7395 RepID=A0A1A9VU10_GLOAU